MMPACIEPAAANCSAVFQVTSKMEDDMETFFLIHNYNTDPEEVLSFSDGKHYEIVDCSDDGKTPELLKKKYANVSFVPNTGHNITTYFSWFADHYDDLPDVMFLGKGNMIGRHVSKEFLSRTAKNKWFTYLYEEKSMRPRYSKATPQTLKENNGKDLSEGCISFLSSESHLLELNNSWYMDQPSHTWDYFGTYDDLLTFIYQDPVIPKYTEFAPGACYIVTKDQILHHTAAFYKNLNKLMNYTITPGFPAEAYIVERMLPIIYTENYVVNPWMDDEALFDSRMEEIREKNAASRRAEEAANSNGLKGTLRKLKHHIFQ